MNFRIRLFLTALPLFKRALCLWAGARLLQVSAIALNLSKRIGPPPPAAAAAPASTPASNSPMTVEELLSTAQRHRDSHFILRMPGLLIEITQVNEVLETAAFNSGSEGHCWTHEMKPFFRKHRPPLPLPPAGFVKE